MGSGEMGTPTKTTKTSTPQEATPITTSPVPYPEWAAAFQTYYGAGMSPLPPPGYIPSAMGTGPLPHPYMWAGQTLVPPYGTSPYPVMYPHGGIYGHPPMTPISGSVGTDAEGKSKDEKAMKKCAKKCKGSLGSLDVITGKVSETTKTSPNGGVLSHSVDSGSEGSSDGSEENSQDALEECQQNGFGQGMSEAMPICISGKQVVGAGPLTNLNIGMDYWNGGSPAVLGASRGKRSSDVNSTAPVSTPVVGHGELWPQDEKELKRQRRKQSNRESARRSRLRKQAECEELVSKVRSLTSDNTSLRKELKCTTEECKKLAAENRSLMEQLQLLRSERLKGDIEKINTSLSKADVLGEGLQSNRADTHKYTYADTNPAK